MELIMLRRLDPGDDEHRANLVRYIEDDRKLAIGGHGVNYNDANDVLHQMQVVTDHFDKSHRCSGVQMIVAFDDRVKDANTAIDYIEQIAGKIPDEYQTVYCVHEKDCEIASFHGHILINPVSAKNGKMMDTSISAMMPICHEIEEITGNPNRLIFKRNVK